jgi:hypothetical protein
LFPPNAFDLFSEVQRNIHGYFGILARGEPDIPLPDEADKLHIHDVLKATREYMESIDPNRTANLNNLLMVLSLDTIESKKAADIAQQLRKIIYNNPDFSRYINRNESIS